MISRHIEGMKVCSSKIGRVSIPWRSCLVDGYQKGLGFRKSFVFINFAISCGMLHPLKLHSYGDSWRVAVAEAHRLLLRSLREQCRCPRLCCSHFPHYPEAKPAIRSHNSTNSRSPSPSSRPLLYASFPLSIQLPLCLISLTS